MNIVLRAASPTFDVDACMVWLPQDLLLQVWHAGEQDELKRVLDTSGFTLCLADNDDTREALEEAEANIEIVCRHIARLVADGVDVQVDLGLFVTAFVPRILRVPQSLLVKLVDFGAHLVISAYPCSDDD